jgi:hypothetical protein
MKVLSVVCGLFHAYRRTSKYIEKELDRIILIGGMQRFDSA